MLVKLSEIFEQVTGCPYCGTPRDIATHPGCCGESAGHYCELLITQDGDYHIASEVEIVDDIDAKQGSL
jgi:hypothetical protein